MRIIIISIKRIHTIYQRQPKVISCQFILSDMSILNQYSIMLLYSFYPFSVMFLNDLWDFDEDDSEYEDDSQMDT